MMPKGGRCAKCGRAFFPYSAICPECGGPARPEEVPKRGIVLTYSVVYISNGRFQTPYTVAIARFGDFQLPGYVMGQVEIGDEVEWVEAEVAGRNWYAFKKP